MQIYSVYITQKFFSTFFSLKTWHFVFFTGIHCVRYPYDLRNLLFRGAPPSLFVVGLVIVISKLSVLLLVVGCTLGFIGVTVPRLVLLVTFSWIKSACCKGRAEMILPHEMAIDRRRKNIESIFMRKKLSNVLAEFLDNSYSDDWFCVWSLDLW